MSFAVSRTDATSMLGGLGTPCIAVLRAGTGLLPERLVIETLRDRGARSHR